MTDETDGNSRSNRSVSYTETTHRKTTPVWTREDWLSLASDPKNESDLGYELMEWEQFDTFDGTDQVMFLPQDESEIKDAAFVVAQESVVLNLENYC